MSTDLKTVIRGLRRPSRLWTITELLGMSSDALAEAGLYGWWFARAPGVCPLNRTESHDGLYLLYVGIGPSSPNSRRAFADRLVGDHLRGTARKSTLRRSLGCLLSRKLGLALEVCDAKGGTNFGKHGEKRLSAWMNENCRVGIVEHAAPWNVESEVLGVLVLPLNIARHSRNEFGARLSEIRTEMKTHAALC